VCGLGGRSRGDDKEGDVEGDVVVVGDEDGEEEVRRRSGALFRFKVRRAPGLNNTSPLLLDGDGLVARGGSRGAGRFRLAACRGEAGRRLTTPYADVCLLLLLLLLLVPL